MNKKDFEKTLQPIVQNAIAVLAGFSSDLVNEAHSKGTITPYESMKMIENTCKELNGLERMLYECDWFNLREEMLKIGKRIHKKHPCDNPNCGIREVAVLMTACGEACNIALSKNLEDSSNG